MPNRIKERDSAPGRLGGAVLRLAHVAVHDERELRVRPAPRRRAECARRAVTANGVRVQLAGRLPHYGWVYGQGLGIPNHDQAEESLSETQRNWGYRPGDQAESSRHIEVRSGQSGKCTRTGCIPCEITISGYFGQCMGGKSKCVRVKCIHPMQAPLSAAAHGNDWVGCKGKPGQS